MLNRFINYAINTSFINASPLVVIGRFMLMLSIVLSLYLSSSLVEAAPLLKRGSQGIEINTQSNSQSNTQGSTNMDQTENDSVSTESALLKYEMFKQIENMQQEIQQLRGLLEEQNHQIARLKKAEHERYADLDRRIIALSTHKQSASTALLDESSAADEDHKTYTSAKAKVDSKEYNTALAEFTLYLEFFPKGKYIPQAHYWMGELYLALDIPEFDNAKSHFQSVVNDFPAHSKVPDSLYKIGFIQLEQDKKAEAKLTFQQLVKDFPKSASSGLAKKQLQAL